MKQNTKIFEAEFLAFLKVYRLDTLFPNENLEKDFLGKIYRRLYGLLIMQKAVASDVLWGETTQSDNYRLYFQEVQSDLMQSLFLAVQGMYKPAFLMLRSSIENMFKCIAIAQNQNVLSLMSTFDLIDVVKSTPIMCAGSLPQKYFLVLRDEYSQLCSYVHTGSLAHMSLTTIVGMFPRLELHELSIFSARFTGSLSNILFLAFLLKSDAVAQLHHSQRDSLLDALPKGLKRSVLVE